jgi:hypothetical protein
VAIPQRARFSQVATRPRRYPRDAQKPATLAPTERPDEAAELLDDLLIALLDLPNWSDSALALWTDVAAALPDELFARLDRYLQGRLSEDGA